MNKKLFIGGLSFSSTEDSIRDAFSKCGTVVSVIIITDRFSGKPKGFGFVEMSTEEEAKAAIDMWDTKELDGRTIHVNEARPMEDRGPRN